MDIPTFHPSWEEFQDFERYVVHIRQEVGSGNVGLARVVPPKEWKELAKTSSVCVGPKFLIESPVRQTVACMKTKGAYKVTSVIREESTCVATFQKWSEDVAHASQNYLKQLNFNDDDAVFAAFWTHISDRHLSTYGADTKGTLFPSSLTSWNLNSLPSILSVLGVPITGVTHSFLYFGMWKAMFAAHTEDMDLYSINYLHTGASKYWYAVPPESAALYERLAASCFPQDRSACSEWLRHKTSLLSPTLLEANRVPFCRGVQRPGEFMITMPRAYHWGFNGGFNVAEAVNFALEDWIPFGRVARSCKCNADSVWIDMEIFLFRYLNHLRQSKVITHEPQAEPSWTFDCCCSMYVTSEDPEFLWPTKPQFQCDECDVWVHHECNYEGSEGKIDFVLPTPALCLQCQELKRERGGGNPVQLPASIEDPIVLTKDCTSDAKETVSKKLRSSKRGTVGVPAFLEDYLL